MTPEIFTQAKHLLLKIERFEHRHEQFLMALKPLLEDRIITEEEHTAIVAYVYEGRVSELQRMQKEFEEL